MAQRTPEVMKSADGHIGGNCSIIRRSNSPKVLVIYYHYHYHTLSALTPRRQVALVSTGGTWCRVRTAAWWAIGAWRYLDVQFRVCVTGDFGLLNHLAVDWRIISMKKEAPSVITINIKGTTCIGIPYRSAYCGETGFSRREWLLQKKNPVLLHQDNLIPMWWK